jgi:hypothetical protein
MRNKLTKEQGIARCAAAAAEKADLKMEKAYRKAEKLLLARVHGLKFFHILPSEYQPGMAIAYSNGSYGGRKKRGDILWMSTSLRNPTDEYSRSDGAFYAAQSYDRGQRVRLRKPSGMTPAEFFRVLSMELA